MNKLNTNLIADALYNASAKSGASRDYARGLVVGLVAGLMATGLPFDVALSELIRELPPDYHHDVIPESWHSNQMEATK